MKKLIQGNNKGFGLIEFVCVSAILGILIVIGIWQYFRFSEKLKIIEANKFSVQLTTAAKNFENDTGKKLEEMEDLVEFSGIPNWSGPYVNIEKFIDPWGEPYFAAYSNDEILVTCSNLQKHLENQNR